MSMPTAVHGAGADVDDKDLGSSFDDWLQQAGIEVRSPLRIHLKVCGEMHSGS